MKVHGARNEDPTEPFTDTAYPFPPIPVETFTKELFRNVKNTGVKAYPIPMAVSLTEDNGKLNAQWYWEILMVFPSLQKVNQMRIF